jgi:hypothetical protein
MPMTKTLRLVVVCLLKKETKAGKRQKAKATQNVTKNDCCEREKDSIQSLENVHSTTVKGQRWLPSPSIAPKFGMDDQKNNNIEKKT